MDLLNDRYGVDQAELLPVKHRDLYFGANGDEMIEYEEMDELDDEDMDDDLDDDDWENLVDIQALRNRAAIRKFRSKGFDGWDDDDWENASSKGSSKAGRVVRAYGYKAGELGKNKKRAIRSAYVRYSRYFSSKKVFAKYFNRGYLEGVRARSGGGSSGPSKKEIRSVMSILRSWL